MRQDDGEIRFTYNWNKKLDGRYFTTIRRYNERKYCEGAKHMVLLHTKDGWVGPRQRAEIIEVKCLTLDQICSNNYLCGLDTGYSPEETRKVLNRMYKDLTGDSLFSYVLYRYCDE